VQQGRGHLLYLQGLVSRSTGGCCTMLLVTYQNLVSYEGTYEIDIDLPTREIQGVAQCQKLGFVAISLKLRNSLVARYFTKV
jgi:hypothetical protein